MIVHMAVFNLIHPQGSTEEVQFLEAVKVLGKISGVEDFRVWRQTAGDIGFAFGISMKFATQEKFRMYIDDPRHKHFANERWFPEVTETKDIRCSVPASGGSDRG